VFKLTINNEMPPDCQNCVDIRKNIMFSTNMGFFKCRKIKVSILSDVYNIKTTLI